MSTWKREGEEYSSSSSSSSSSSIRSSTVRYQVSLFRDFELFVSSVSKCQHGRPEKDGESTTRATVSPTTLETCQLYRLVEGEKRGRPSRLRQKGVNDEYVPLHRGILHYESLHLRLFDPLSRDIFSNEIQGFTLRESKESTKDGKINKKWMYYNFITTSFVKI